LQPQNLLLTGPFPDCDIKLCDFGIARHIARGADVREILGTPDYVGQYNIVHVSFVGFCANS
jgi:serine/threonine protein kinase